MYEPLTILQRSCEKFFYPNLYKNKISLIPNDEDKLYNIVALIINELSLNIKRFLSPIKPILNETYEAANISKVKVESKSTDINIYEAEDDKFKVEVYGDDDTDPEVSNEDETLSINLKNKTRVCFGICLGSKINIYVPKDYEGKFEIETKSGDILSELKTYNEYKIDVTSGDITLNNVKSLEGHATSGDLEIDKINNYLKFKTTSGDQNSSISVTSGDVTIDKCTNAYVDASVKSGDIDIKKNDRHAEYELKIKTTSGDVEVN